jgi:hypothetical protein
LVFSDRRSRSPQAKPPTGQHFAPMPGGRSQAASECPPALRPFCLCTWEEPDVWQTLVKPIPSCGFRRKRTVIPIDCGRRSDRSRTTTGEPWEGPMPKRKPPLHIAMRNSNARQRVDALVKSFLYEGDDHGDILPPLLDAFRRLAFRLDQPAYRLNVAYNLNDLAADLRRSTIQVVSRKPFKPIHVTTYRRLKASRGRGPSSAGPYTL